MIKQIKYVYKISCWVLDALLWQLNWSNTQLQKREKVLLKAACAMTKNEHSNTPLPQALPPTTRKGLIVLLRDTLVLLFIGFLIWVISLWNLSAYKLFIINEHRPLSYAALNSESLLLLELCCSIFCHTFFADKTLLIKFYQFSHLLRETRLVSFQFKFSWLILFKKYNSTCLV